MRAAPAVVVLAVLLGAIALGAGARPAVEETQVRFVAGADAAPERSGGHVAAFHVSAGATRFTATVLGVPGARLDVGSLVGLVNADLVRHSATLAAPTVRHPAIEAYRLDVRDARGDVVASLDLLAAAPAATVSLAPGETVVASLSLALAEGATDALTESAISLTVS